MSCSNLSPVRSLVHSADCSEQLCKIVGTLALVTALFMLGELSVVGGLHKLPFLLQKS